MHGANLDDGRGRLSLSYSPVAENRSALSLSGGVAGSPRRGDGPDLGAVAGEAFPRRSLNPALGQSGHVHVFL